MAGRGPDGRRGRRRRWAVALAVGLALTGCAGDGGDAGAEPGAGADATVTVFAAASLAEPMTDLAQRFEAAHAGVTVRLSLGGSSDLAAQVVAGAPADVFASADVPTMESLGDVAVGPRDLATNRLQIAVPPGNPAGIRTLADLAGDEVRLVVCAAAVPCGRIAREVASAAAVRLDPVSQEQSVTDVLGKVASGEADAGLVYVTDVLAARGSVEGIAFPEAAEAVVTCRITTVAGSRHERLARQFVDLVTSDVGRTVLDDAGFGRPG